MTVELLRHTPLWVCSDAIRTCWQSQDKSDTTDDMRKDYLIEYGYEENYEGDMEPEVSVYPNEVECGEQDIKLINRVALQFKHQSTMEHLVYNFSIKGISRACLQELARHRIASLSVKSTRYTLKELKNEEPFNPNNPEDRERACNYLISINEEVVDTASILALENLRKILVLGISNDKAKYCLPEAYKTDLAWTINARALSNFIHLRSAKAALPEIRELAKRIYDIIPISHQFLFPMSTDE